jgi:hypothetical protein
MSSLFDIAQDILDVMWFDHFETVADKRSLAADILRVVINQLQYDTSDWMESTNHMVIDVRDILKIVEELEQF